MNLLKDEGKRHIQGGSNSSGSGRLRMLKKVEIWDRARCRKGGEYYGKRLEYERTGLRSKRNKIRANHAHMWQQFKNIIAPDLQLHHRWNVGSANYTGLALVEKDQHMRGFIDVIQILDGEITLFTEKKIRERRWY